MLPTAGVQAKVVRILVTVWGCCYTASATHRISSLARGAYYDAAEAPSLSAGEQLDETVAEKPCIFDRAWWPAAA